jgi:pyridinium-3,5-biscarboxylic acid mononucleotide sulfurtransferase
LNKKQRRIILDGNRCAALEKKEEKLFSRLRMLGSLVVAYSGGADSAYLAWAAHRVLGQRTIAVTALSPSFSCHDRDQAMAFAQKAELVHELIDAHELENPLYVKNDPARCYHCKAELFAELIHLARARGFAAVAYGANADDVRDFRPGHRAAAEHGVVAPLAEVELTKSEIRELSRRAGLPSWDRPASACLSSRVPYGVEVTPEILWRIEQAEAGLRELGFRQLRVRSHGDLARVEISPDELSLALELEMARAIAGKVKQAGFTYVCLDLEGYRQGSLNAVLRKG